MSNVIEIKDAGELESVLDDEAGAVVLFTQPRTCAPCRAFAPHFAVASTKSGMAFAYVDLDVLPEAAFDYGVRSVPTVLKFDGRENVTRLTARTAPRLLAELEE